MPVAAAKKPPPRRASTASTSTTWAVQRLTSTRLGIKLLWGPHFELLVLEAVSSAIRDGKVELWRRIRRNPRFNITLGAFIASDLKQYYNAIITKDNESMTVGHLIIPMLKNQRATHCPEEHITLSSLNAIHPPLYGPRFGQVDSDDEFPDPPPGHPSLQSPTLTTLADIETPGFLSRVEDVAVRALRGKLSSAEYQAVLMNIRADYKDKFGVTLDPVAIPPVDGIIYCQFPSPPADILPYLQAHKLDKIQLLAIDSFFPTVQDEYRYLFQQAYSYYTNRLSPMTFTHHPELYTEPYLAHAYLHVQGWTVHCDPARPAQDNSELTREQTNAMLCPKYANKLGALKTFLNNVLGLPLWYTIIVANFLYEFQGPQHRSPEPIQPQIQEQLHAYQRLMLNIIINDHFRRNPTSSFGSNHNIDIVNPKDRFQTMFYGGGRHYQITSPLIQIVGQNDPDGDGEEEEEEEEEGMNDAQQ